MAEPLIWQCKNCGYLDPPLIIATSPCARCGAWAWTVLPVYLLDGYALRIGDA